MAIHPLAGIELFSGTGMLGEGFRSGLDYLGIPYRTICHVEREAYAASVMVARIQEGSLDEAPIWPDVTTFDAAAWRGKVDCVVSGFPCQDLSVAGRRAGLDGKRSGLFFEVIRIADDCGAWLMLLENVAGIASATASVVDAEEGELDERAASRVVGELADCGWNAEWITLSASDVGASHGRARWFCIAWRARLDDTEHASSIERSEPAMQRGWKGEAEQVGMGGCCASAELGDPQHDGQSAIAQLRSDEAPSHERWPEEPQQAGKLAGADRPDDGAGVSGCEGGSEYMVNASSAGFKESRFGREWELPEKVGTGLHDRPELTSTQLADTNGIGLRFESDGEQQSGWVDKGEFGLFAPGPTSPAWKRIIETSPWLSPALEPTFCGMVNGLAFNMGDSRSARLKCIGNGVVALQAALATILLVRRSGLQDMIAIKETKLKQD